MSTSSKSEPKSETPKGKVLIGRILSAHGTEGEFVLLPLTDFPGRFFSMDSLELYRGGDPLCSLKVLGLRENNKGAFIVDGGLGDRESAKELVGAHVVVNLQERVPLPEGHFWVDDLIGLRVETVEGLHLGTVTDFLSLGAHELYEVRDEMGKLHYIPAVSEFVQKLEPEAGRMVISLIEGLWD
ncbi:MAG: 16S rRNA processing protein RimM [Fretibacterium sp.]|nr:16S rRNA processing protein RimM [Fretibacterium sp.]